MESLLLALLSGAVAFGFLLFLSWRMSRRRKRLKFPIDEKLLRWPGETLAKKSDDAVLESLIWLGAASVTFAGLDILLPYHTFHTNTPHPLLASCIIGGIGLIASASFAGVFLKKFGRLRDDYLGYFGERLVGEYLDQLKSNGYRVFHDIQCEGAKGRFNIDHVAVGPNGVFVVETKSARKPSLREANFEYKITYDGTEIIHPRGRNRSAINQVCRNADWLSKRLNQMLGLDLNQQPVLVFPGWYVTSLKPGAVIVANHKTVAAFIRNHPGQNLSDSEVDLIGRQLDLLSRDVDAG